jgi:hypothetical protein
VAPTYFLRQNVTVDVPRPPAGRLVAAPASGKINIRANPDNCQVFIDGEFVEYPPILDRAIAAGEHRVGFQWPDWRRAEESVQVARGAPAYVMGPKGLDPLILRRTLLLVLLLPSLAAAQTSPEDQARGLLEDGRTYRKDGKLKQALDNFQTIVSGFPNTSFVDDALLEIGRYYLESTATWPRRATPSSR